MGEQHGINIQVDEKVLQSLNITNNTVLMLRVPMELGALEADYLYKIVQGIIYRRIGVIPELLVLPAGAELEILPDETLLAIQHGITQILKRRTVQS